MLEGSWPLTMTNREGAHSGELQYAELKTTPPSARRSRLGVLMGEFLSCRDNKGAAIWSAMM